MIEAREFYPPHSSNLEIIAKVTKTTGRQTAQSGVTYCNIDAECQLEGRKEWWRITGFDDVAVDLGEAQEGDVIHVVRGKAKGSHYTDKEGKVKSKAECIASNVRIYRRGKSSQPAPSKAPADEGCGF